MEINSIEVPDWLNPLDDNKYMTEVPDGAFGFVYKITLNNGKQYVGRKNFYSVRKRKFGKKELALITDKRLKKYEVVKKESDWRTYIGSNAFLKKDINDGAYIVKREVISVCKTEKYLTYCETMYLFLLGTLENDNFYNDNILGKFFKRDIIYERN